MSASSRVDPTPETSTSIQSEPWLQLAASYPRSEITWYKCSRVTMGVRHLWVTSTTILLVSVLAGCSPGRYRMCADQETYAILEQKAQDSRWQAPSLSVAPGPESRNFDPYDPDSPPLPVDDPTAHQYMHYVDGKPGYEYWHENGNAQGIESLQWMELLETNAEGQLELDAERVVELGIQSSRGYQFQLENLYLAALALTLERFEFDTQWFGVTGPFFEHFGTSSVSSGGAFFDGNETNTLSLDSNLGFTRSFASGGQLLVDFANTFLWEFAGPNSNMTFSDLRFRMVQPLLRRFGREVRLEDLTQRERNVLYALRDFARFRKQFYFDLVSGDSGYLALLLQLQSVRNLESNVESLEQNLVTHEALSVAGIVSPLQVDQVFQDYQAGKLRLIQAKNRLQTSLDAFKIRMGLPPELEVTLDDTPLQPFELNSADLAQLQQQVDQLLATYRDRDDPPAEEELAQGLDDLLGLNAKGVVQLEDVMAELNLWEVEAADAAIDVEQVERERAAREQIVRRLSDLETDLDKTKQNVKQAVVMLDEQNSQGTWEVLQTLARQLSSQVADMFVLQAQIRANLVELDPVDFDQSEAINYALENRLDLMNQRGGVVDAWRKIKVAADALEADLDVIVEGDVATDPDGNNPVKFSARDSSYRVGVRFDGPLNRLAERNVYRAQLIEYQRSRRNFIANRDAIVQDVRRDLRDLSADRLNFEITRQSLITAARQVELARVQLLAPGQAGDSSTTQDVLRALDSLLASKNALIGIWVAYETDRLRLLLDTEALQLNQFGLPSQNAADGQSPAPGVPPLSSPPSDNRLVLRGLGSHAPLLRRNSVE